MTDSRLVLQGRRVILAHADDFHRSYLSEVLGSSGARVTGASKSWIDARALLDAEPSPDALVLGSMLLGPEAIGRLNDPVRKWAVLIVGAEATGSNQMSALGRTLPAPYAGFQVVHALCELLGIDRSLPANPSDSPRLRGH